MRATNASRAKARRDARKAEIAKSPLAVRLRQERSASLPPRGEGKTYSSVRDPNRDLFLARCATAYDAGLCTPDRLKILQRWAEIVMRLEGGQLGYVVEMLAEDSERTNGFRSGAVLANDSEGYAAVQLMALLNHPCQSCATDPAAWWTRPGFCPHRKEAV